MVQRAEKKLYLDTVVHHGDGVPTRGGGAAVAPPGVDGAPAAAEEEAPPLDSGELLATLKFGADALFRGEAGAEPTEEELDALCDRTDGGDARRAALGGARLESDAARSVADFQGSGAPLSSFILNGEDFTAARRAAATASGDDLAGIAAEFLERSARARTSTVTMVDGFAVKRANMYSLEAGEPSVFATETAALEGGEQQDAAPGEGRRMEKAGRDYPHADVCQVCWTDGTLYCCDHCPAAYHAECVGETARSLERANPWACPHHACGTCGRKAAAAGGLIFRCECCASAFCEDHLPEDVIGAGRIVGECQRFVRLGQTHPAQACFIHCSATCAEFAEAGFNGLDKAQPLPPGVDPSAVFDYVSQGAPWHEAGDDALLLPTPTGRLRPLSSASYSDLKNYLYGVRGAKFQVRVRGRIWVLEDIKIRDLSPALRDNVTAAVYAEARVALQEGLAPERRSNAASQMQPAYLQPQFAPNARREKAALASGQQPGELLPERRHKDRVVWSTEEEAALRAAIAKHGAADWQRVRSACGEAVHPKRTAHDLQIKYRLLQKKDAKRAAAEDAGADGKEAEAEGEEDEMDEEE
jgi:hypothetical protein